jgi:hypothetical protein
MGVRKDVSRAVLAVRGPFRHVLTAALVPVAVPICERAGSLAKAACGLAGAAPSSRRSPQRKLLDGKGTALPGLG